MNVRILPSVLSGRVDAIASKSDVHRLLFCAAQADAPVTIRMNAPALLPDDLLATVEVLRQLGAFVVVSDGTITVTPGTEVPAAPAFDCRESGSTLRFLLPLAAAKCTNPSFTGQGRLPDRPVGELLEALAANGIRASGDRLPFSFEGNLHSGIFELPGDVSSQYITGLLLALPGLPGDSEIRLTTPLQSAGYVDITLHALRRFGVRVDATSRGYHIPGGQTFRSPGTLIADGDWSNAAGFFVAGAIGKQPLTVCGLSPDSPQGDRQIVPLLKNTFGASVTENREENGTGSYTIAPAGPLKSGNVDVTDIPDLFPVLAAAACFAQGRTTFTGGERLRLKESDRIATVRTMIEALGGTAEETPDGLIVCGVDETGGLTGGTVDACNDHRIVMAASLAATACRGPVTVLGAEAVNKSYPSFFRDLTLLGGNANAI